MIKLWLYFSRSEDTLCRCTQSICSAFPLTKHIGKKKAQHSALEESKEMGHSQKESIYEHVAKAENKK